MAIRARVLPRWPVVVQGTGGVTVTYANARATVGFDYAGSELGTQLSNSVTAAADSATAAQTAETNAETAETAAEAAAAIAVGAIATFATYADAEAFDPGVAPDHLRIEGYNEAGDGGQSLYFKVGSEPSHPGKLQITEGSWYELVRKPFFTLQQFGAVGGDASTNDTTAINNAFAALTDGHTLRATGGRFQLRRGDGTHPADNLNADNITIEGDAIFVGRTSAGAATPDSTGNQFYNVFQAYERTGITIRGIGFEGFLQPMALYSCEDVTVDGISDNALIANDDGDLRDKSIYLSGGRNICIINSSFLNHNFAVYAGGGDWLDLETGIPVEGLVVANNHFEHTVAEGAYTSLFPVGVYLFHLESATVTGNVFKNIYSSVDSGNSGTGLGYGIYEGDGASGNATLSNNTFVYEAKGAKRATAIICNEMQACSIVGNSILVGEDAEVLYGIYLDAKNQDSQYTVTGNSIINLSNFEGTAINIQEGTVGNTNSPRIAINGNVIQGFYRQITHVGLGNAKLSISNNVLSEAVNSAIFLVGSATIPLKHPIISGNQIIGAGRHGVLCSGYVISPSIIGNMILDGNTTGQSGADGSAVFLSSSSHGSVIDGNRVGNTPYGGGLFTDGFRNADSTDDRIFKDVIGEANTFQGLTGSPWVNFPTSSPSNGIFDASAQDTVKNTSLAAAGVPKFHCVFKAAVTVTADASSASTTVTVASTTGAAVGDIVLLVKDNNPYNGDWTDTTKWHRDTIATVTDGTHIVLTTGIPAGDGTYVGNTAVCHIARYVPAGAVGS